MEPTLSELILLVHDGSTLADKAIEVAISLARESSRALYILAIAPFDAQDKNSSKQRAFVRSDDLGEFAELSKKFGIEVVGGHIVQPTESALRSFIKSNRVVHVVMASDQLVDGSKHYGRILSLLARNCPVPVSLVP